MSGDRTQLLIESLTVDVRPVRPLAPPLWRGLAVLGSLALVAIPLIFRFGDVAGLVARYGGRESLMLAENGAMLATGLVAGLGAFFVSIPGRSRLWLVAPLPFFAAWIGLSGLGCYQDFIRIGGGRWGLGESMNCLIFLLVTSLLIGLPLFWLLSRAKPVDPLPAALLGGLCIAALSAFLLQFFHPFAVTLLDLAVHFAAVAIVVGLIAFLRRPLLRPA